MNGPSVNHNATACHGTHLINPSLEPYNGKGPVTADRVSKQSTRRSRDPRLVESLHTTSIQQGVFMIQNKRHNHVSIESNWCLNS